MKLSLANQASHGAAALKRALSWPSRLGEARRAMRQLAGMSDHELRDIGLVRQDIVDASMLRIDAEASAMLKERRAARERIDSRPKDLAA
jgi:uncharacterized protein YjiS (DUF1127 family)